MLANGAAGMLATWITKPEGARVKEREAIESRLSELDVRPSFFCACDQRIVSRLRCMKLATVWKWAEVSGAESHIPHFAKCDQLRRK